MLSCIHSHSYSSSHFPEPSKIFVLGGYLDDGPIADVEIVDLNPDNPPCRKPADMPVPNYGFVAALVNGSPVTCGGVGVKECYRYSIEGDTWHVLPETLDQERRYASSVLINDKTWWIAGGSNAEGTGKQLSSTLIYDVSLFQL